MNRETVLSLIADTIKIAQKYEKAGAPRGAYNKMLREPIFFMWETDSGRRKYDSAKYRSKKAKGKKKDLIYDHSVPFKYLERELLELENPTPESVREVLDDYGVTCTITKAEDKILNKAGLNHKMPDDWDGDPLARYKKVGIVVERQSI